MGCLSMMIPGTCGLVSGKLGCACCWLCCDADELIPILPGVVVGGLLPNSLLCGIELEKFSQAVNSAWDLAKGSNCCNAYNSSGIRRF